MGSVNRESTPLPVSDHQIETCHLPQVVGGRARGGRASQQDQLLCLHDPVEDALLLLVADGMGGDGAGELASEGVSHVARQLWQQGGWRDRPGSIFLESLCQDAHLELRGRGRGLASGEPHSTVVALLVRGNRVSWVHVGDSRLYFFQGRRCLSQTEDHSVSQLKVRRGELDADQMADDADQHKLLQGLGGPLPPQVDHGAAVLRPGQAFVLCSDGIWEHLSSDELGQFAGRRDQADALREAITLALERAGAAGDNVALILFRTGWAVWLWRRMVRLINQLARRSPSAEHSA